jgi:ribosomal protein S17E
LSRFDTTNVSKTVRVIIEKYMVSGMKYETGIAIGLSAVTEATNTDQRKVRNLIAIKKVKRTVPMKKTEFMALVQA